MANYKGRKKPKSGTAAGIIYAMREKHQKQKRNFGVVIMIAFLLIPLVFILLYISSDNLQDKSSPASGASDDTVVFSDSMYDESINIDATFDEVNNNAEPAEPDANTAGIAGTVYLTFDDGPSRDITPGILDVLAEEGVIATFFMLPYSGADDIFRRVIDEGHEIGNHSYSHVYSRLYEGSVSAFREDVFKAHQFMYDNFGYTVSSFRFPGGSMSHSREIINPRKEEIKDIGYRYFDWHVDPDDWRVGRGADIITRDILDSTDGREHVIILLHDVYASTLEALPGIIAGLRQQGYGFDILKNFPE